MSFCIELRIQLVDASLCRTLKSPAQGRAVSEGVIEETRMVLSQAVLAVLDSCQIPQDKQIHLPVNVIDSLAFQAQAAKIASTWRWSVPQQPPRTLSRGSLRRSSQYSLPSSRGLPASNSALSSSSAWLQRDALARTPGTLDAPPQMPSLLPLSARLSGVPGQAVPSSRVPSPPHTPPLYRAFACSRIGSSPQADDLDPLSSRI
jgi:hypothetical protein